MTDKDKTVLLEQARLYANSQGLTFDEYITGLHGAVEKELEDKGKVETKASEERKLAEVYERIRNLLTS